MMRFFLRGLRYSFFLCGLRPWFFMIFHPAPRFSSRPADGSAPGAVRSGRTDGPQKASGKLTVAVGVTDLAHFLPSSSTVVQIYAAPLSASRTGQVRYKKMLAGFTKAAIAATGSTTVQVERSGELPVIRCLHAFPLLSQPGKSSEKP